MRLFKILTLVITIHLGFGFTQLVVSYFGGDVADYGAAGFVSHTPIGAFIDLSGTPQQLEEDAASNPKGLFDFLNRTGDTINALATFDYGFLNVIPPDAGFVYTVVWIFRLISRVLGLVLIGAMIYVIFDSNLLSSKLGMALVGLGLSGTGALSVFGGLF